MIKKFLKKIFNSLGYELRNFNIVDNPQRQKQIIPQYLFDLYFSIVPKDDFFFVQIGANDGETDDLLNSYIKKYDLAGVLVEPQRDVFEKLKKSYEGNKKLVFANKAISNKDGVQKFYKVNKRLLNPDNYFEATAISSFNKEVFEKTLRKRIGKLIEPLENSTDINDYIEEESIEALTFDSFARMYDITHINFLFLDCEGYDYEILKLIDFAKYQPSVVNFESKFLSDSEREECESYLEGYGYKLFRHGNDTCAFK
jgi:FkbM family methyltransferase